LGFGLVMKHLEGDGPYLDRHPNLVSKKTLERHIQKSLK